MNLKNTDINDAILVFEKNGQVEHRFCTLAQAKEAELQWKNMRSGGSIFTFDGQDAEFVYSISTNTPGRVEKAKDALRRDIAFRDVLDRNGVPKDNDLRISIYNSVEELRRTALLPVF